MKDFDVERTFDQILQKAYKLAQKQKHKSFLETLWCSRGIFGLVSFQYHRSKDILRGSCQYWCPSQYFLFQILGRCILARTRMV